MPTDAADRERTRKLPWYYAAGALNAIFCAVTFYGSAFVLFLSELNLDKSRIGFLFSLTQFCGLIALFLTSPSLPSPPYTRRELLPRGTQPGNVGEPRTPGRTETRTTTKGLSTTLFTVSDLP